MEPIRRALWYIEGHYSDPVGLDDIAASAGVSRFHLSRTFSQVTGRSVTAYLRARRLTEAARAPPPRVGRTFSPSPSPSATAPTKRSPAPFATSSASPRRRSAPGVASTPFNLWSPS